MQFRFAALMLLMIALPLRTGAQSDPTRTPINHLIVIMQENHSFDNYFGTYPTSNGTLDGTIAAELEPVDGIPKGTCLPYGASCLRPYRTNSSRAEDPIEGQAVYEQDYDGGKMDGFARFSGPQSLAYFDQTEIAAYWTYAEEYGLGENYFAPVLSTTNPNRLMFLAGNSSVANNDGPPPFLPYNDTILHQLSAAGISWTYFDFFGSARGRKLVPPINYLSDLDPKAFGQIQDAPMFFQDLNDSRLPSVTFLNAIGFQELDEHPPWNVTVGELWVVSIVNAVMESNYWASSAILITYDEGGGYYDHVAPPQLLTINNGFQMPLQGYGQRVPFLVISPYGKEDYVSNTLLNHMSILRFIEYNWNLPPLNQNVADSNNLLDFFYFDGPPRAPIILKSGGPYSTNLFPAPIQIPFDQLPYSRNDSQAPAAENPNEFQVIPYAALAITVAAIAVVVSKRSGKFKRR